LVRVGRSEETWDKNVLGMNKRDIHSGLKADAECFGPLLGDTLLFNLKVFVATETAAGVKGETELEGAMPVSAVPHLKSTNEYGKRYVHLRIELLLAAGSGGGGGSVGPIGALLLCGRR